MTRFRLLAATATLLPLAMASAMAASTTTILSFNGTNGASAAAGITPTGTGKFFVVTQSDSVGYAGTVDILTPPATASGVWKVKKLTSFSSSTGPGYGPAGALVTDTAGNAYGTLNSGGANGCGGVFKLTKTATGYSKSPLYVFKVKPDACAPWAGLTAGSGLNFYGTATSGGSSNLGAVFSLTYNATTGKYAEKVIYNFSGADGSTPYGKLLRLASGALIGTTTSGGANGFGTVFKLSPPATAGGSWALTTLHDFTGGSDSGQPYAGLIADVAGNLYGAAYGVFAPGGIGPSTIFKLSPNASSATGYDYSVVYTFDPSFGTGVFGDLAFTSSGQLIGTAQNGGPNNGGIVFVLDPPAGGVGSWALNTSSSLQLPDENGRTPYAGLTAYGTSFLGTTFAGANGYGAVFKFTP